MKEDEPVPHHHHHHPHLPHEAVHGRAQQHWLTLPIINPEAKAALTSSPSARLWTPSPIINHPGHAEDVLRGRVEMGVGMAVAMVHHLMLGDDHNVWNTSSATPTELLSLQLWLFSPPSLLPSS